MGPARLKLVRMIATVCTVALALLLVSAASAFALTREGAEAYAAYHAELDWPNEASTGVAYTNYCTGPYENKQGKTQWACYGGFLNKCLKWQVNVGPYGEQTYHTGGCTTIPDNSGAVGASQSTESR